MCHALVMSALADLIQTVARLRGPGGCPWDQEQTHQSLCEHLIEECTELLDAIDRNDVPHMREELGDVLLQVILHAQIASESGHYDIEAVAAEINDKLIRRHPHVFGDVKADTSDEVLVNWDRIKAAEKKNGPQHQGPFKVLPSKLPALLYARDIFKQLDKSGTLITAPVDQTHINEMADELTEEEAGELLFNLAAACRIAKIDPEAALRRHASRLVAEVTSKCSGPLLAEKVT